MTTSRIVRGTKGRIFIYVCAILIVAGVIACYNNTRVELENAQKSSDLCHQQQENLSTQLQVISDYKQRLEKSLKTEKAEHQQAKTELETRLSEEKLKHQKAVNEATLKYNSLEERFNSLEATHEEFKEESSKTINDLKDNIKELHEQLKQAEKDKEDALEHLKTQMQQLRSENLNLEKQIQKLSSPKDDYKMIQMNDEENNVLNKPDNQETLKAPNLIQNPSAHPNYSKQVSVASQEYKISNGNSPNKQSNKNDLDGGLNFDQEESMKANNEDQKQIQSPNNQQSSSTSKTPKGSSKANLELAPPLKMTPETVNGKSSSVKSPVPIASPSKSMPQGVAMQLLPEDDKGPSSKDDKGPSSKGENDLVGSFVNNRYRNVAANNGNDKDGIIKENVLDAQERENGAHEVFDVMNEDSNNVGGKRDEQVRNHLEEYDQLQQNEANLDENEDDEADDYPHNNLPKEAAIRN